MGKKQGEGRREGGQGGTYLDMVEFIVVRDANLIADRHAGEGTEGSFEHRAGVGDLQEIHGLRTELDVATLGEGDVFDLREGGREGGRG